MYRRRFVAEIDYELACEKTGENVVFGKKFEFDSDFDSASATEHEKETCYCSIWVHYI